MRFIAVLLSALALAGCGVSPTKYEPMGGWGGYEDTQINQDTFEVKAVVNYNTQAQVARDYSLIRSAQLACMNGYPYFEILDDRFTRTTGKRTAEYFSINRLKIKLHKHQNGDYYDAAIIYNNMKTSYSLPDQCQ